MCALGYEYLFRQGLRPSSPPLLLLHGTGGDEHDLVQLALTVSPGSTLLSLRGDVLEPSGRRFFKSPVDGKFDLDDVKKRSLAVAAFTTVACRMHELDPKRLVAFGFSNGANVAASMLLLKPESLAGAVLLRPMVILDTPAAPGTLTGKRVLICSGNADPIVPNSHPSTLASMLRAGGADVTLNITTSGHGLTAADIRSTEQFLAAK